MYRHNSASVTLGTIFMPFCTYFDLNNFSRKNARLLESEKGERRKKKRMGTKFDHPETTLSTL